MERLRGFEIAKGFENSGINIPVRKTKYSAGYDVEAAEDCIIPVFKLGQKPTLIKTGLKAYMQNDEYLMLCNRSSNPFKKGLVLANSVGIVDADYYGNPDNDGAFMFAFYNVFDKDIEIKKGDIIGQAIFKKYEIVDNDVANDERIGGFGSTSNK
ncbi:MAG: dUTP diphosphatase [Clostridiales bacterium]|nr:dUTP diphosphatase [Clostridiales bacterium]